MLIHNDDVGNIEWSLPWQTSWRRKLFYCTTTRWVPWKCSPIYLWDLLQNTSANWHGVCTCSLIILYFAVSYVEIWTFVHFKNIFNCLWGKGLKSIPAILLLPFFVEVLCLSFTQLLINFAEEIHFQIRFREMKM